ncbi:hypothetical protein DL96DRAFT_1635861 [Flagelloscypha sp. PMI_526]|nr:hypothetical protein DL96DRAFT_1635861 [Flagelloscypha sp. PMI_526]
MAGDPVDLFPEMTLRKLERLYLGIEFEFFCPKILGTLASKTPNLRTLALLAEYHNNWKWTSSILQVKCKTLVEEFQALSISESLLKWNIWDFGIIFRECNDIEDAGIPNLAAVLGVVSQKIPSISSFYGTGGLRLWDGMASDIDPNWGGKLWLQRKGCW